MERPAWIRWLHRKSRKPSTIIMWAYCLGVSRRLCWASIITRPAESIDTRAAWQWVSVWQNNNASSIHAWERRRGIHSRIKLIDQGRSSPQLKRNHVHYYRNRTRHKEGTFWTPSAVCTLTTYKFGQLYRMAPFKSLFHAWRFIIWRDEH
jgi:hypothetical protein